MDCDADSRQVAVALRYAEGDTAPVVVAKGRGVLADEIIRRARDAGLFVHESRELVALLLPVDLAQRIPPVLSVPLASHDSIPFPFLPASRRSRHPRPPGRRLAGPGRRRLPRPLGPHHSRWRRRMA